MSTYVLDACALIAFFNGEEGADTVESLLSKGENVLMSMLNAFEVCYNAVRSTGEVDTAISILHDIRKLPILLVETLDQETILAAVEYKTSYRMSVADAIALGLAKKNDAFLVTADHHEFDPLAQMQVAKLLWIR